PPSVPQRAGLHGSTRPVGPASSITDAWGGARLMQWAAGDETSTEHLTLGAQDASTQGRTMLSYRLASHPARCRGGRPFNAFFARVASTGTVASRSRQVSKVSRRIPTCGGGGYASGCVGGNTHF